MATNRVKGITIEIGGDTTGLDKALSGVNKEINGTKKELKDVEKLLKMDPGNTELLKQKQEALKNEVAQTSEKLETLKNAQAEVSQQYANGEIDKGAYDAFQREIIATENELKNLKKELSEANVVAQKLADVGKGMKNFGAGIEEAGKKVMPVSLAVAGVGAEVIKITADFDAQMSKVQAISGATAEEIGQLRDKARLMGETTKFSAAEAGEAMEYMAMAGWDVNDMLEGLDGIMNLAAASGEELALTSDIVTDALSAFGEQADQSNRLADILAAASSNANTNVAMMGESFKYAANTAGSMGYTMEDTAIALGLMANTGVKASRGGTALNNIMTRMAKKTKESGTAMKALDISLDDGQGHMYCFMDIMKKLRDGFGQLKMDQAEFTAEMESLIDEFEAGEMTEKEFDKAQQALIERAYDAEGALNAQYAAMLAGKTGMGALLAIVNASPEDFDKLTEAVYNSTGTAQEMAEVMQDNLSGQITILMSQLQELALQFGEMLMPAIREIVGWIQKFVDKLNNMDEGTRNTILKVGLFIAALGPLLIVGGKIISGIGTLLTLIPTIMGALSSLFALIAANPIVLAIGAIIAIVILCIKYWDEIKITARSCWEQITDAIDTAKTKIGTAIEAIKTKFKTVFEGIWSIVKGVINKILGGLESMVNGYVRTINAMLTAISKVASAIGKVVGFGPVNMQISEVSLPRLAKGGIVSDGSAIVGEAGAELLNVSNGRATVQPLTNGGNASHTDITDLLKTYLPYLAEGNQIVLDSGALVGATAPAMNNALGMIAMRANGR